MPSKPKRPCSQPGCGNLTTGQYCEAHVKEVHAYDRYRGSSAERGYDSKWRKAREHYLIKHPLCVECEKAGVYVAATDLDHITPHKGDMKIFWDRNNWQGLCKMHHSRKTAIEDGGFGNRVKKR